MPVTMRELFVAPKHPPGHRMAGLIDRVARFAACGTLAYNDGSATYPLFNCPADTMAWEVVVDVGTLFNGTSPTITIGDGGDVDRFFTSAEAALATAGVKSSKKGGQPGAGGFLYTTADTIDAVWTEATGGPTTGSALFYLHYVPGWSRIAFKSY